MPKTYPSYHPKALDQSAYEPHLSIGPNDHAIEVPRVDSALADTMSVDEANPWYSTDGFCLFTKDGSSLIRCLTNVKRYKLPESCTKIEDEAFAYNTVIREVSFHDGVTHVGDRAFIGSTLDALSLPESVRSIGMESFAEGKNLQSVDIAEGLASIGDGAFAECRALKRMRIPATVTHIGNRVFDQCGIVAHGPACGLHIAEENTRYFIDDSGVLYRRDNDGLALMSALDRIEGAYEVADETVRILPRAFSHNRKLRRIEFPESLEHIGDRAFLECGCLESAALPENVKTLGTEAFYHTSLKKITIPASLEELGPASLVVNVTIANQGNTDGTLGGRGARDFYQTALSGKLHEVSIPRFDVEVSPDNARFSLRKGFLCERTDNGDTIQAVQFVGTDEVAEVPLEVSHIAAYALFGVENVHVLRLHVDIEEIGHSALAVSYPLDMIEVLDDEETPMRFYPAPNSSGTVAQRKAFRAGWLDLNQLAKDCDSSLSFMMPGYERSQRMLLRLVNGRMLADRFKREYENTVRISIDELVRKFASVDNRQGIRNLLDLGFIDKSSIAHAIEVANSVGGVACSRLLLEEKRTRFPNDTLDFSL